MRSILPRVIPVVVLVFLLGAQSVTNVVAADKADQKTTGQPKAGKASRNVDAKLVGEEEALDELSVLGEGNSNPCVTCDPEDPLIQDKVAIPVPGSSGTTTSFIAQEEARAAGARMPAMQNPNINFFQSLR